MRKFILFSIFILFWGCSSDKVDEKKLEEFIKENFKDYELLDKPIIKEKYKNLILVSFAKAGTEGVYSVVLSHKGNKFKIVDIKKGDETKKAIFTIGKDRTERYSADVKLGEKLIIYEHSIYGKKDDYCNAYVYKFENGIFVFDEKESLNEKGNYCYEICQKIDVDSRVCNPEIDQKKLSEFIKNNFSNYKLSKNPIIIDRYKSLVVVRFSTDYKSAILLYKNNEFQSVKVKKGNEEENAIFKTVIGKQVGSRVKIIDNKVIAYDYSISNNKNDYCEVRVYDFDRNVLIPNREAKNIEITSCMAICSAILDGNWKSSVACSKLSSPEKLDVTIDESNLKSIVREKFGSGLDEVEQEIEPSISSVIGFKDLIIVSAEKYFYSARNIQKEEGNLILKYKDGNFQIVKVKKGDVYEEAVWSYQSPAHNLEIGIDGKIRRYTYNSSSDCNVEVYDISDDGLILDEKASKIETGIYCKIKDIITSVK